MFFIYIFLFLIFFFFFDQRDGGGPFFAPSRLWGKMGEPRAWQKGGRKKRNERRPAWFWAPRRSVSFRLMFRASVRAVVHDERRAGGPVFFFFFLKWGFLDGGWALDTNGPENVGRFGRSGLRARGTPARSRCARGEECCSCQKRPPWPRERALMLAKKNPNKSAGA